MNFEGEREQWDRRHSCTQGVFCVLHSVATMIIMELNNCFSNYRCCETTVKATVCSSLLGVNGVIDWSAQQIDMAYYYYYRQRRKCCILFLKTDMIWWNYPSFLVSLLSLRRKNVLICVTSSSDPVGKSSSKIWHWKEKMPYRCDPN